MKRTIFAAAVLALAACKDDPVGPGSQEPAVVAVTTEQTVLVVGGSVTLGATVYDAGGKKINNAPVKWTSLNPDVASVSGQGVVTGITVGEVTIEAESSGKTGSVTLTVDPDPCTNPINLSVGQVRILSGPDAVACITLAQTSGSSDFLFITANATQAQDNTAFYSVMLDGGSASDIAAAARQSLIDPRQQLEMQAMRQVIAVEERMREQGRNLFRRVRPALRGGNTFKPSASIAAAPALAEGDMVTLRVPDINASNLCMTYKEVQAVVKKTTPHATIVQDVAAPSNGFTASDFTEIGNEFESLLYQSTRTYFGNETDRNGDGRVTILYTPEVNEATPSGSQGFVAGFFWPGDLVKKSEYQQIGDQCPQTNEQEIFYMLVPDPAGTINSNQRSVALVKQNTRGTIAHEFQHMINQGMRLLNPVVDSAETTWLNEALSHMAEEVVGRTKHGYGDFQRLSFSDVNPSGNQDDYNAFFRQNLARYRGWMQRPDTSSPTSQAVGRQLAPRGAAWMFLRYTTDHHSNNNMKAFLRSVVAGPDIGLRNLLQHAGGAQFDDLLSGWLISQFTDGLAIPGLPPRYRMLSWDVHDVMTGVNGGNTFPLHVTPLPNNVDTKSISGSGNYFRLTRVGASSETTFRMVAPSGSILNVPGARVYVVRIG